MNDKPRVAAPRTVDQWWSSHHLPYNPALMTTAMIAYTINVTLLVVAPAAFPDVEFSLMMIFTDGILFTFGLAAANVCYLLGAATERMVRPRDVDRFRKFLFGAGLSFSIALLLLPTLMAIVQTCSAINSL